MPEYLAPGVYLEEIASGTRTIEGVSTSTAGFVGETERGPVRPTLVSSWAEFVRRYGGFCDEPAALSAGCHLPYAVRGFFENGGRRLVIGRVAGHGAATAALAITTPSGSIAFAATGPGTWGNAVYVTVQPSPAAPDRFTLSIEYGEFRETFADLSPDPSHPRFAVPLLNRGSEFIELTACPNAFPPSVSRQLLSGGTDASTSLHDYLGRPPALPLTGLAALSQIHGISILSAPEDVRVEGLSAAVLDACVAGRDRFAVTAEPDPARETAGIRPVRESSWGATYHPWLRVPADHVPGGSRLVPPHGHICGIYARVDASRGVHRPPANEEVRGITGLSHAVSHAQQEVLNTRGINVIRDFRPQRGVLVWGARTMSPDVEWKYINVRRLFIFIERSIDRGLQWVVFEPNAEPTWFEVRRSIEDFLTRLWRDGALMGDRVERAFYVRCDRTTMTQSDLEQGRLVCEIGVAPLRPAEFVVLRFSFQTTADDRS